MILTIILLIAMAFLAGYVAQNKGYNFWAWFFSGGLIGLIVLLCLPNVNDTTEDKKAVILNRGNTIGIVIAVGSFVWGLASGLP
jgi:hypothetical protein